MQNANPPLVVVIAGPNGAGKSTTAPRLLQEALAVSEFVNADAIALGLSAFRPEGVALPAARAMLSRIKALARARATFAFETTLASRSFAPRLTELQADGYLVHLLFLSLPNPDLAVARVAERVRAGGHDVPEAVVRRRYVAGLRAFFRVYTTVADSWQLLDNAEGGNPTLIASRSAGRAAQVLDQAAWDNLLERQG